MHHLHGLPLELDEVQLCETLRILRVTLLPRAASHQQVGGSCWQQCCPVRHSWAVGGQSQHQTDAGRERKRFNFHIVSELVVKKDSQLNFVHLLVKVVLMQHLEWVTFLLFSLRSLRSSRRG